MTTIARLVQNASDNLPGAYQLRIGTLDEEAVRRLFSLVRTLKQTDVPLAVLIFESSDEPEYAGGDSFDSRHLWSKSGQILTRLISGCGIMFVAIVEAPCFGERFELAAACHAIIWDEGVAGGLAPEGQAYFPYWGTLARLREWFGQYGATTRLLLGRHEEIRGSLLAFNGLSKPEGSNTDEFVSSLAIDFQKCGSVARRLSLSATGDNPLKRAASDHLESTIFANQLDQALIDRIDYLPADDLESKLMAGSFRMHEDDGAEDYRSFDQGLDYLIPMLEKKDRIQQAELLISQRQVQLRGRCIELGSGGGYFSAMLSRSPKVEEVVALDISASTILRWGPIIWDHLKPNWEKLRFMVGDMNSLKDGEGTYDTAVFCASLHHSSDIPRSLQVANELLKVGGVLALPAEHYDARFLCPKKRPRGSDLPTTIDQYSKLLRQCGFRPVVFRFALPGKRFPRLKRFIFSVPPFKYLNGLFYFNSFVMLGIKQ